MSPSVSCSSSGIIFSVVEEVRNTQVNHYIIQVLQKQDV